MNSYLMLMPAITTFLLDPWQRCV